VTREGGNHGDHPDRRQHGAGDFDSTSTGIDTAPTDDPAR